MKALISPNEILSFFDGTSGVRVCETHSIGFEVAEPLFWAACEDTLDPSKVYWDGDKFCPIPVEPVVDDQSVIPVTVTGQ